MLEACQTACLINGQSRVAAQFLQFLLAFQLKSLMIPCERVECTPDRSDYHDKLGLVLCTAARPPNDADPDHPGLRIVVASSFSEIVLDESKHVLLDVSADWCGPSVQVMPPSRLSPKFPNSNASLRLIF